MTRQPSPRQAKQLFGRLEVLRNDLAHACDILQGRWPELADRAAAAEQLLQNLERATGRGAGETTKENET